MSPSDKEFINGMNEMKKEMKEIKELVLKLSKPKSTVKK